MVQFTTLISTFAITMAAVQAVPGAFEARQAQGGGLRPDPQNGLDNIGAANGKQFITGGCTSNADCASGCCAAIDVDGEEVGICSGPAVGDAQGKKGCGSFEQGGGGAGVNGDVANGDVANGNEGNGNQGNGGDDAAAGVPTEITEIPTDLKPDPVNGLDNIGAANGKQFITGECTSDADCASGCCATVNNGVDEPFGICSGPGASLQNGKQCCGFPDGPTNCPNF